MSFANDGPIIHRGSEGGTSPIFGNSRTLLIEPQKRPESKYSAAPQSIPIKAGNIGVRRSSIPLRDEGCREERGQKYMHHVIYASPKKYENKCIRTLKECGGLS